MCILINHPATTEFDFADIADFYDHNSDGMGVMYAENDTLHVQKFLPSNAIEAYDFYVKHCLGRDCVLHLRMQTHGPVQIDNSHPFAVFGDGSDHPIYLAHNGILHTGNDEDPTKTDSELYIKNYIRPLLEHNPTLAFHPSFIELLETHIGSSNKFIMMDYLGQMAVVNESAFVEYKGAMLSNTYAWDASKGGYGSKRGKFGGYYGSFEGYGGFKGGTCDRFYYPGTKVERPALEKPAAGTDEVAVFELDTAGAGDLDDEVFAQLLFEYLDEAHLRVAYKGVTWSEAIEFYHAVGEYEAYALLEDIAEGWEDDAGVMSQISQALLRECLATG